MICFHILKVKAETGVTERRREAVTKNSEEDHDREKVKNRKKVIVYEAYPKNGKKIFDDSRKVDLEVRAQWEGGKPDAGSRRSGCVWLCCFKKCRDLASRCGV